MTREPPRAQPPEPPAFSSKRDHAILAHLTSLLDQYWVSTMTDAERVIILDDWLSAMDGVTPSQLKAAKQAWLKDRNRGTKRPKPADLLNLIDELTRKPDRTAEAPSELSPRTTAPWAKRSPAEHWSSMARLHAWADAIGKSERPFDAERRFYDGDLVAMAMAEAMQSGDAERWRGMRGGEREYLAEPPIADNIVRPYWRKLRLVDMSAAERVLCATESASWRETIAQMHVPERRFADGPVKPAYVTTTYEELTGERGEST